MLINGVFPCLGEAFLLKRVQFPLKARVEHSTLLIYSDTGLKKLFVSHN